ncbi:MAG: alpha/beta fold hydrolase [Rubrivivax sp.]|nr:alpha/beta fold hydrolase [Rubrivivax sp.]
MKPRHPGGEVIRSFALALPHGITLQCRAAGARSPRVLLLHGFPEAAFVWDEVMKRLAPRVGAVAPNLRGFAGSSAPTDVREYRVRHLVADVAAAIRALLGPGQALDLLVAHDWGGALAWHLAAQQPELMRRLVIVNSPHPATFLRELRGSPAQQKASAYMNWLCRPDAASLLAANDYARLWPWFGEAPWLTEATKGQYREAWAQGLEGPLNYYRASPLRPPVGPEDAIRSLSFADADVTVRVPTTVLWGERDEALLPGLVDGLERWVPQLELIRVPEGSHWLVHEQPERVAGLLAERLLDGPQEPSAPAGARR